MRKIQLIFLLIFSLWANFNFAQNPVPAKPQSQAIVLKGGTLHDGNGNVLENAAIRFEDGKITEIGSVNEGGADVIDITGKHIYPGLILPSTSLGLVEIEAVRASRDYEETGDFNPNARALIAYNTDSEVIPVSRSNGILLVQTAPRGGIISGTSSVMELDGWNWEDAVHTADEGLHLHWIVLYQGGGWWAEPTELEKSKQRDKKLQELTQFFQEAKAYWQKGDNTPKNLKFEATKGVFDGTKTLYIYADLAHEIMEAVLFAKQMEIRKIAIIGGAEALEVSDLLVQNQVPVILERVHRLPTHPEDDVFLPYKLPYLLSQRGVLVALTYEEAEPMGIRNLPFLAGTAAAYGMPKEEALKLITSNPAKILGIADKVGTLEIGKEATLIVSTGDLLDMRGNNVEQAFIRGKNLTLDDKQKRLYQIYKEKYQLKN